MITEAGALDRIFAIATPLAPENIPVIHAHRRRAAAIVRSPIDLPRFDQSAMDGYAIRATDAASDLRVIDEQPAGRDRGLHVQQGEAVRIFTGAPIPRGATAVVMQEDVDRNGDRILVRDPDSVDDEFIRRAGGDLCAGQTILDVGDVLSPARLALLLSAGITDIAVHRRPRIGIITTGDELRPPGTNPAPGELIDSNGHMLAALVESEGPVESLLHAPDDPSSLAQTIESLDSADVIVISGGVSVGDHDPVHAALAMLGAERIFWKVDVKPGKPLLFARLGHRLIFGLPGNPVSSFVTAVLFLVPTLRRLGGALPNDAIPIRTQKRTACAISNPGSRPHYLRGSLRDDLFHPALSQQSHGLLSLATSDALALIDGDTRLPPGAQLSIIQTAIRY